MRNNPSRRIRGLLCDVHGVLYIHPDPVPGSVEAVRRLAASGFPHAFLTNSTQHDKAWIVASLRAAGFDVPPERLVTAAEAAGRALRRRGHRRVGWLCAEALARDIPGVEPVLPGRGERDVDAVLVGDLGEGFTYRALNEAFRWLLGGAELVALARNRAYQTPEGLVLDSGPFVGLLEEAAGVAATVAGKPAPELFRTGLDLLGLAPSEAAMVGDDLDGDVLPAMDLGMTGVLVRTGKFREAPYAAAPRPADRVVADLREAVEALLGGA